MKHGDKGPRIEQLQNHLIRSGYPLPRWGADGVCGDETIRAALSMAMDLGVEVRADQDYDELPDIWVQMILDEPLTAVPDWVVDRTQNHPLTGGYKTRRPLTAVTAIVLHQTACRLGTRPGRWDTIWAHIGIPADGQVILINDFRVVMWHANWFNRFSVGIEIDGNFCGIENEPRTLWKPGGGPHVLTPEQVDAACDTCAWICKVVEAAGGQITHILAHRQTSKNRRADPGSEIWKAVGMWAMRALGLKNDPNYTKGSGLPIPREWDPRSEHGY